MRYKASFLAGFAVGFVAGARSGRQTYDQMVGYAKQVSEHPTVQQYTQTVQQKANEFSRQAAAKAPDYAKNAATNARSTLSSQATAARQAASTRMPSKLWGRKGTSGDDVTADGNLVYPAETTEPNSGTAVTDTSTSSTSGARYTPDTP